MSTRQQLYYAWCLAASTKEIIKVSNGLAKDSIKVWFNTSPLMNSVFDKCQFYHDPQWEDAKRLSENIREGKIGRYSKIHTSKKIPNIRKFSTYSKVNTQQVCK